MKHIKDIHPLVERVHQRIVETMQERGLTKIDFIPSAGGNDEEPEDAPFYDESEWEDLNCPTIIYCDNLMGQLHKVVSVELVTLEIGQRFKLNSVGANGDDDCFYDYHVEGMQAVYEELERVLGIDSEPEKIWLVKQESNVNGQMLFNVTPCNDLETAKRVMEEEINTLLSESHFKKYRDWPDDFKVEQTETSYFIRDTFADYYEDIEIEEKGIK